MRVLPLLALVLIPFLLAPAKAAEPGPVAYTGSTNSCGTALVSTDHCLVRASGTLGAKCQTTWCVLRFEGGVYGESKVPSDLWLRSSLGDLAGPTPLETPLCEEMAAGITVRCAFIKEVTYPLEKGQCLTLRQHTTLSQGAALFRAANWQDFRICRDGSGQPTVTWMGGSSSEEVAIMTGAVPFVTLLP